MYTMYSLCAWLTFCYNRKGQFPQYIEKSSIATIALCFISHTVSSLEVQQ